MLKENLIELYQKSFRENKELPALSDYFKKESFSYFEMAKEIAKLHLLFEEAGLQRGDKVALIGRNNPRWCIVYIATITYGAVIVPILQDFSPNDVHHIINHSDSVLLFAGDIYWDTIETDNIEQVRAAFSLTDFHCLYERHGDSLARFQREIGKRYRCRYPRGFTSKEIAYPKIDNDSVAVISYTSGTTGFSKGVMLTINNLTGNVLFGVQSKLHFKGSRIVSFLPLAHAFGCAFDFLAALAAGTHITLLGKIPSPKILIEAMGEVKPHLICIVPLILEKIYRKQIKPSLEKGVVKLAMRVPLLDTQVYASVCNRLTESFGGEFTQVIAGGAPLNSEVEEFLHKIKFRFTVGYGLTECAPLISYTYYKDFIPTSCGRVLDGLMEAKIDSPDPQRIPGEICVRGEHVMKGYYKNPEATRQVIDEEGWLHTGDIGTMNEDNTLFIKGRSKSMILSANGQNIYPEEIESKLNNMSCVLESLVVERDGKLVALVYPDYEQADEAGISYSDIQRVMDENKEVLNTLVAPYEQVTKIMLWPNEFEKTPKKASNGSFTTVKPVITHIPAPVNTGTTGHAIITHNAQSAGRPIRNY